MNTKSAVAQRMLHRAKIAIVTTAVASPLLLAPLASAATMVVTPTNTQGWAAQDGTPTFVSGPAGADGAGSLKLTTDTQPKQNFFHAASTPLAAVSGLGYKVDVTAGVPASYQLQITGANRTDNPANGSTFTSLVWEPVYNGQQNGPNGGFVTESNLESGIWWSSKPIAGAPNQSTFVPLSTIIANNPNATIVAYGVNVGSGTPNATSFVDDVALEGTTANFEPFAVATDKDQCKNDGYKNVKDADGNGFKNQGQCVSYTNGRGNNTATLNTLSF